MDFLKNNEKRKQAIKEEMDIAFDMNEDQHDVADGQNQWNQNNYGWQVSRKEKRRRMNLARKELVKHSLMSPAERQQKESLLWYQSSSDRWRLYRTWVRDYVLLCQDSVKRMQEEYNRHSRRLAEVRDQESLHILKTAKVVGMSTTGAAKLHTMLQNLKPSIMIVEEAAEVLEAHIVAGLTALYLLSHYETLFLQTCGEDCVPCTEPCLRACPHNQCSALCSQPCTGKLCSQPCKLLLPCGHPCIGLCGEQCPTKCRFCHSEEVTQVFFGPEDEPDARFVELTDCHHVVHAESMDSWVEQAGAGGQVGLAECPMCKTAVRTTCRYNNAVNHHLIAVERVKTKLRGEVGGWVAGGTLF